MLLIPVFPAEIPRCRCFRADICYCRYCRYRELPLFRCEVRVADVAAAHVGAADVAACVGAADICHFTQVLATEVSAAQVEVANVADAG